MQKTTYFIKTHHNKFLGISVEDFKLIQMNDLSENFIPLLFCKDNSSLLISFNNAIYSVKSLLDNGEINLCHEFGNSNIKIDFCESENFYIKQDSRFFSARQSNENFIISLKYDMNNWEKFSLVNN
ncbi:hypothetical protein ABLT94_14720 [Acinetobacter soli]|uniref:hypothetical protein n=1 Tax=Acinetobacter soli TaxID=487316 RepID=UPI0032B4192B